MVSFDQAVQKVNNQQQQQQEQKLYYFLIECGWKPIKNECFTFASGISRGNITVCRCRGLRRSDGDTFHQVSTFKFFKIVGNSRSGRGNFEKKGKRAPLDKTSSKLRHDILLFTCKNYMLNLPVEIQYSFYRV